MRHLLDTIVAPITAPGGAIAVVRMSGPRAWRIGREVFRRWPDVPIPRLAVYGTFSNGDDGFALPFAEGHSYTGDETVEFSLHGSQASLRTLIEDCLRLGARHAQPGEFTLRAFMFGRIDLTQAEGVRDTVCAATSAQLRQATLLREGRLYAMLEGLRDNLSGVLASVEASADFSEEIGELDRESAYERCMGVVAGIEKMLATAHAGRVVREGITIAIVGRPNVGKSSLLNRLLSADRAIVTEVPGTTRDTLEEPANLGGWACKLIDTAGMRHTADQVERLGVERTQAAMQAADVVWMLYDASEGWTEQDEELLRGMERSVTLVAHKCDLQPLVSKGLPVSSLTGEGVNSLIASLRDFVGPVAEGSPLIARRHQPLLEQALEATLSASETLKLDVPYDLAAVELMQAIRLLGEITGETATPDMVERVFRDFCIGK